MASSWGSSWGTSWGDSWGATGGVTPAVIKTGTGGIDPKRRPKIQKNIFKPTGLLDRRVEETRKDAEEISQKLKEEFIPQETQQEFERIDLKSLTLSARDREIAELLHEVMRKEKELQEDEDFLMVMAMML